MPRARAILCHWPFGRGSCNQQRGRVTCREILVFGALPGILRSCRLSCWLLLFLCSESARATREDERWGRRRNLLGGLLAVGFWGRCIGSWRLEPGTGWGMVLAVQEGAGLDPRAGFVDMILGGSISVGEIRPDGGSWRETSRLTCGAGWNDGFRRHLLEPSFRGSRV